MLSLDKIPEKIVMCHLSSLNCVRLHCTGKGDIWYRISIKAGTWYLDYIPSMLQTDYFLSKTWTTFQIQHNEIVLVISKAVSKHYRLNIEQESSEFITFSPPLNSKKEHS